MRTGSRGFVFGLVLAASMLLSPVAPAQTAAAQTRDWSALKTVATGSKLAVKLKGRKSVEGKLTGVSDTALSLTVHERPTDFGRDDILRVYRVKGRSAAKSTLIGAGAGAAVGAVIGAAGSDDNDFILSRGQATAALATLGAGAGALVGFAVGKAGHKRVLIYDAGHP